MSFSGTDVQVVIALHALVKEIVSDMPQMSAVSVHDVVDEVRHRLPALRMTDAELIRIATETSIGQARPVVFQRAG